MSQKKIPSIITLAFLLLSMLVPPVPLPAADQKTEAEILEAAESVFLGMARRDYRSLWAGLSAGTRRATIRNVQRAVAKAGLTRGDDEVHADFEQGIGLALDYWKGYLSDFDPKLILEESRWSLGEIRKDQAEILLRHRKSDHDAHLKMFREGGRWKVGLDETFSSRQR